MMPNKLVNIKINEVSAVDKAANQRRFLIVKRAGEGGDPVENETLKDKLWKFAKGLFGGDEDGAKDLNTFLQERISDDLLWKLTYAFQDSLRSIIEDDTVADKKTAVLTSLNQLFANLVDNGIVKAGRKISGQRLDTLKTVHEQLGKLISDAGTVNEEPENNSKGENGMAKQDAHPEGCMCEDCKKDRGEDVTKSATTELPADIKKRMDDMAAENADLKKRLEENEKIAKTEREERLQKDYIAKAAGYKNLSVKADEFGLVMKALAEKDPENFTKVEAVLRAADASLEQSNLFKEAGRGGAGESDVMKRVEAIASEMVTKNAEMTKEQAIAKVWREHPELYKQYQAEQKG